MPRIFTVESLRTRCQQLADMEGQGFISDAEWNGLLSTQYAELYSEVVETGMRYFETIATIAAVGADTAGAFALPAAHLSTVGVDYVVENTRRQLIELMHQERNTYGFTRGESQAYALAGRNIVLYPPPASGQSYEHIFVPQPPDLTSASDGEPVDVITPDGEGFLAWGVAVRALAKEGTDASLARAEREDARARLKNWAVLRSLNTPRRMMIQGEQAYDAADWVRGGW